MIQFSVLTYVISLVAQSVSEAWPRGKGNKNKTLDWTIPWFLITETQ